MDKRKLSKIPRVLADQDMMETAARIRGMSHIVTASLIEDKKILQLTFYRISGLCKGKPEADFRTFLSDSDYITQDLNVSKVKWLTASFSGMRNFSLLDYVYDNKKGRGSYRENVFIRSDKELKAMENFFIKYMQPEDDHKPWDAIERFQHEIMEKRLDAKHKKILVKIDAAMKLVKKVPKEFFDWVWETGMSFSRYFIYKEGEMKGRAVCECTYCGNTGVVDRKDILLRNNGQGICPFCGSRIIIKARGRMPEQIIDKKWFLYVEPMADGFVLRYFKAFRHIKSDRYIEALTNKGRVEQSIYEYRRAVYRFPGGKPECTAYEWGVYKQRGMPRWCPDTGNIDCMDCILYPGNLPQAWAHTPMKYSALEVLSGNIPLVPLHYENAVEVYQDFPKLEWFCKMGLNSLARNIINGRCGANLKEKLNFKENTIYKILGLTKINTRVLQEVDGDYDMLRLLQVSQKTGIQFSPEQLQEYYETFACNTKLLEQANKKVSLHKLVKYIGKESERYPLEDKGCCRHAYMTYMQRIDPLIERMRNMANDWLDYLEWCRKLKYDLNNMFIYMPTNFKKVHDRTYKEYQAQRDRIAAAERKRQEHEAARKMKLIKKAVDEIFKKNDGVDAFTITGKGLVLVVPKSADEIKAEGAALHHCVGSYVELVAKGKTMIFFVRKIDAPEEPYYTMEWNGEKVVQCRGFQNCGMTPEVEAFIKVFEKKMAEKERASQRRRKAG